MAKAKTSEFPRWYYPPEAQPDAPNGGGVVCYNEKDIPKGYQKMQAKVEAKNSHDL